MSADREAQNSSNQSIRKIAVAARLLARELHRLKLKRVDLPRANGRLGEKAYALGAAHVQPQIVSQLDRLSQRLAHLRQSGGTPISTFGDRMKAAGRKLAEALQIGWFRLQRRRTLRQLGDKLRQAETIGSVAEETQKTRAVRSQIDALDAEIKMVAAQTYFWARRPLLLMCLILLFSVIVGVSMKIRSTPMTVEKQQQREEPLTLENQKTILAQTNDFAEQTARRQAELLRKAQEEVQRQITAAERTYKEQQKRQRAEAEKRQRAEAEERERVAAAAHQEEKQREEERRVAAEKAREEQHRRHEAEEQRAKAEAVLRAEQQKEAVRKIAQAFYDALERNDMRAASSLALGEEKQLALAKAQHDFARSFVRMQLARTKKFGGDQARSFFDSSWRRAEEHIDGDRATVNNGMISYTLRKSDETWKVNLPESNDSEIVSVASTLTHEVEEITSKVEKGDYKNDKEAQNAFEAKLAATAQTSRMRSEDSLAVERWLRSRLAGGMTERQIVEASDLIARKFASPEVAEIRRRCFNGTREQRQFDGKMVYSISKGEYVSAAQFPTAQAQAKRIDEEIDQLFPARAVFETSITQWKAKALPPVEEPIHEGPKPPGLLVNEHLEGFENAMLHLADAYSSQRPHTGKSRLSYYNDVKNLQAGDVLYCLYESGGNFFHERPYFFWYRERPPGLDDLLRTLPKDHPIRQIGPPLEEAPPTLDLAMKANVATAEDVKKIREPNPADTEEQALAESMLSGIDPKLAKIFRPMFRAAADADHTNRAASQTAVRASGGTKMLCPVCNGYKKRVAHYHDSSRNPYKGGNLPHSFFEIGRDTTSFENCDECHGTGVVAR